MHWLLADTKTREQWFLEKDENKHFLHGHVVRATTFHFILFYLLEVKLKFRLNMVMWQMTLFIIRVITSVMEILLRIIRVMEEQKVIQRCRVMNWAHRMQHNRPK